ncbi:unnamed protein product [Caenorhabditis auriculariae]|uniref:Globin family profile domain-containing protein n=1 Tax=Caenorhabditis auriculariae TaxID=2777116 RepID=A0A8S1HTN5_9PELO|nr:unnamed protein product [Caenorhabditis auriculariae]
MEARRAKKSRAKGLEADEFFGLDPFRTRRDSFRFITNSPKTKLIPSWPRARRRAMHNGRLQSFVKRLHRPSSTDHIFICSKYTGRLFVAEPEDVNKIVDAYHKVPDKYAMFESMFIQLFVVEEVEFAVYFGLENLTEAQLRLDQRFRTHVGKFQRFMNGIMDMLSKGPENADEIVDILRIVGRNHGNVRSMSFTAEKWLIFKNDLLALLCKDASEKICSTWSKLISFIISEIKDGYLEHVRHARSSSCPQIAALRIFRASRRSRKKSESVTRI